MNCEGCRLVNGRNGNQSWRNGMLAFVHFQLSRLCARALLEFAWCHCEPLLRIIKFLSIAGAWSDQLSTNSGEMCYLTGDKDYHRTLILSLEANTNISTNTEVIQFPLSLRSILIMVRLSNYFALICLTSIVVLVIIVVSQLHRHRLHSSVLRYRMVDEFLVDEREPSDTKTILFWTKFFEDPYWDMKAEAFRKGFLESVECPVTNCVFTSERNLLAHEYEYDAIVFHAPEPLWDPEDLPKARSPHQVYIMASKEWGSVRSPLVCSLRNLF